MSQILAFYKKYLGAEINFDKFHFEVEGEGLIPFKDWASRLEKNDKEFSFKPDPFEGRDDEPKQPALRFSLLKIAKIPENETVPGLILKSGDTLHSLIHHSFLLPEHEEKFREDIHYKLRHIGCQPDWKPSVSSSAIVTNPMLNNERAEDRWMKHRDFRYFEQLERIPIADDPNVIIGKKHRFLCKGGSFLIVAPSGVGKSTLMMQMAMSWAAGRDFFGLAPTRALRCFLLQGENDDGDVAEMAQGIKTGLQLADEEYKTLTKNFKMRSQFGMGDERDFSKLLAELIEVHKPDVFFLDPLFAFIQGNYNDQELISECFRRGIHPVLKKSNCILVSTHHTPKPAKETPRTNGTDFSYSGFGTSELTNWYRAVATLRPEKGKHKTFRFIVAKRGARAGFPDGLNYCLMRHSEKGLFWEKIPAIAITSPDGPLPQDEYDALKLFVRIKSDFLESREDIFEEIKKARHVNSPRSAATYWATVRKYFIKEGSKYRALTPKELSEADRKLFEEIAQKHPKPKAATTKVSPRKAPRKKKLVRPSRKAA
ncbi:MAG: AAA family ATPase [Verrucomicrobiota bacterium]